ncbi:MAG: hypothetical protein ACRD2W_16480 [Acidimicrobiales bacterium]
MSAPDTGAEPDVVLSLAVELALSTGTRMVEPPAIEAAAAAEGIGHDRLFAALVELRGRELVQLATAEPSQVVLLAVTNAGLRAHLRATRQDLADIEQRLARAAAAAAGQGAVSLAEEVGEAPLLVECLLDDLVSKRRLIYSKAPGRRFRIHRLLT